MNCYLRISAKNIEEQHGRNATAEMVSPTPRTPVTAAAPAPCALGVDQDYILNAVIIYQDEQTSTWAGDICTKAAGVVGGEQFRAKWWRIEHLTDPFVLAQAVCSTKQSDMTVVAIRASQALPHVLRMWAELSFAKTCKEGCALVVLLEQSPQDCGQTEAMLRHFEVLSQQSQIELLIAQRRTGDHGISMAESNVRGLDPSALTTAAGTR